MLANVSQNLVDPSYSQVNIGTFLISYTKIILHVVVFIKKADAFHFMEGCVRSIPYPFDLVTNCLQYITVSFQP